MSVVNPSLGLLTVNTASHMLDEFLTAIAGLQLERHFAILSQDGSSPSDMKDLQNSHRHQPDTCEANVKALIYHIVYRENIPFR